MLGNNTKARIPETLWSNDQFGLNAWGNVFHSKYKVLSYLFSYIKVSSLCAEFTLHYFVVYLPQMALKPLFE